MIRKNVSSNLRKIRKGKIYSLATASRQLNLLTSHLGRDLGRISSKVNRKVFEPAGGGINAKGPDAKDQPRWVPLQKLFHNKKQER